MIDARKYLIEALISLNYNENAHPDEPMFILLGRDPAAPFLVNLWAAMRAGDVDHAREICEMIFMNTNLIQKPISEDKLDEAQRCAIAMTDWRQDYDAKIAEVTAKVERTELLQIDDSDPNVARYTFASGDPDALKNSNGRRYIVLDGDELKTATTEEIEKLKRMIKGD